MSQKVEESGTDPRSVMESFAPVLPYAHDRLPSRSGANERLFEA